VQQLRRRASVLGATHGATAVHPSPGLPLSAPRISQPTGRGSGAWSVPRPGRTPSGPTGSGSGPRNELTTALPVAQARTLHTAGAARDWIAARWGPFQDHALRWLNVGVAGVGLLTLAPVLASIATLIKLTSRGPVLYRQVRIGRDRRDGNLGSHVERRRDDLGGKPFKMFKFRTMREEREHCEIWAHPNDRRVTPLGRVLRQYRLDELPQFVNVLRGEMNVVGPRPEQPRIFARLRGQIEGYSTRQRVHPGITGLAQIRQGYDRSVDDVRRKVALDREYIASRSLLTDLIIMVRTLPVMLGRRGGH